MTTLYSCYKLAKIFRGGYFFGAPGIVGHPVTLPCGVCVHAEANPELGRRRTRKRWFSTWLSWRRRPKLRSKVLPSLQLWSTRYACVMHALFGPTPADLAYKIGPTMTANKKILSVDISRRFLSVRFVADNSAGVNSALTRILCCSFWFQLGLHAVFTTTIRRCHDCHSTSNDSRTPVESKSYRSCNHRHECSVGTCESEISVRIESRIE